MDFSYSEEQVEVQQLARRIFSDLAGDEQQKTVDDSGERFDAALWQQLAKSGLLGVAIDPEYGGMGFGYEALSLLAEETGRRVAPVPVVASLVSAVLPLQRFGSEAQKTRWLPAVASGDALLSAALAEPLNDDMLSPQCRATQTASGYRLDGCKHAVPLADRADRILLAARAEEGPLLLLLDPRTEGVQLNAQLSTSGEPWFEMRLDGVAVAANELLAAGVEAAEALRWVQERTVAAHCMMAVGVSDTMLRMTASYTSEREQFGRPIATFQAVGQRAADCFIDIEALRLVSQQAVSLLDREQDASEAVTIAKIWCGDVTHRVSNATQHLHGGIGVDRDYPLFRYCLWSKQLELALGSTASCMEQLGKRIAAQYRAA